MVAEAPRQTRLRYTVMHTRCLDIYHIRGNIMKAVTGYLAITCVSVILAAIAVKGMTPTAGAAVEQQSIQANIKARNAQLAALDRI